MIRVEFEASGGGKVAQPNVKAEEVEKAQNEVEGENSDDEDISSQHLQQAFASYDDYLAAPPE